VAAFWLLSEIGPGGGDAHAEVAELAEDHLGYEQVAGEPVGAFDEQETRAVRPDVLDQLAEAFPGAGDHLDADRGS